MLAASPGAPFARMRILPQTEYCFNAATNAYELLTEPGLCPRCLRKPNRHGRRRRMYIDENGDAHSVFVVRLRCPVCGKTDTVLPENLLPGKRYAAACVETGLEHANDLKTTCLGCEESTVRTWVKQYQSMRGLLVQAALEAGEPMPPECPHSGQGPGWLWKSIYTYHLVSGRNPYHQTAYGRQKPA